SMYSVNHEGGHALYDSGSSEEYAYTALDGGVSMGIHESQSRFYENIIGRSYEFCEMIYPKLIELFPELTDYSAADIFRAVNKVSPSLIRTEADETTYCLHVMVRYELEKRLMNGTFEVHDLPAEWNRLYKEYLGVDVPDDKQGVLQDSHWSGGGIGYFPSYALGSAYGVQFLNVMNESFNVYDDVEEGNFTRINNWNKENIWKYGCLYKSSDLLKRVLGGDFNPDEYLDYLEEKAKKVYDL
ncbi:MAG: carboxypeptidase M32, partial [Clostridia bacterium]|nr:carboxypeptidase M32 [Clostridia bacterium]